MKAFCLQTCVLCFSMSATFEIYACAPDFHVSYFPYDANIFRSDTWFAQSATNGVAYTYRIRPHLGTELSMIGAHYYPAWTAKAPKSNRISTAKADKLDFFAAGRSSGKNAARLKMDWQQFAEFSSNVCKRLENGERVDIPRGVPDYALEFYLYKLGHAEWLVFRKDEDPSSFGQLLALPKERRLYRTVWVHFVRIANARKYSDKDRHLNALRRAIDVGYKDTAGLESFTLRFLSATCGDRYAPLVLTSYSRVPWAEWPGFAKRIFLRRYTSKGVPKGETAKLCTDLVGVEVAIALGAGGQLPTNVVRPDKPALSADRQAWIAFNQGDFELCRRLLALAPAQSLIRLFIEARLARLDGNLDLASKRLHEWLKVYCRQASRGEDLVTGYYIDAGEQSWYTGSKADGEYGFSNTINYSGTYGPTGYQWEVLFGCMRDCSKPQSHEPTLPRVVAGELGVVMVASRDLEEALYAFLRARNWVDIAFVAERCMTIDELIKFMHNNRINQKDKDLLKGLLMRRLMRTGRISEAITWVPTNLKPLCEEYQALSALANDNNARADDRAVAFLNLSRLTLTRGMELMGTELRPDVAVYDGDFQSDELPLAEPTELPKRMGVTAAKTEWSGWTPPCDRVSSRFHYRRKAIQFAKAAVEQSKDPDVRAWSLMFGGVASLSLDDVQAADWFYKKLARMRHKRARLEEGWFKGAVYRWFKDKYYEDERHAELRVPKRFTIRSLKRLEAPGN